MSLEAPFDTIIAPATPAGRSALAVVRIDGPDAWDTILSLSNRSELKERVPTLTLLRAGNEEIDEAVVTAFRGPRSFTGNDLVEVSMHGNPSLVETLLRAAITLGCRMAEPGEFTERAVLNGKLDLVQAEAISDLIHSRTSLQAKLSLGNLRGSLSDASRDAREKLLFLMSRLEGALDFADEGYVFIQPDEALALLEGMETKLSELEATYRRASASRRGLTAVILGKPNAGKSTLLNALVGSERAIVTPVAGTTRDLIRETIELGGLPVTIVDTAGLRGDADIVEEIGIARAREAAREAEIVFYLIDSTRGADDEDLAEVRSHPEAVVVHTKSDLASAPAGAVSISVSSGEGMAEFLSLLDRTVRERFALPEGSAAVVNERQRAAVSEALDAIREAKASLVSRATEEIVLADLYRANTALGRLTGIISSEEIFSEIFSKFCIGK